LAFAIFSFGGYGLALAALALVVFGAIECPRFSLTEHFPSVLWPRNIDEYATLLTALFG